jgi:hypothetical protein
MTAATHAAIQDGQSGTSATAVANFSEAITSQIQVYKWMLPQPTVFFFSSPSVQAVVHLLQMMMFQQSISFFH